MHDKPDFSDYLFASEMMGLYSDINKLPGVSEATAELVVRQAAIDAMQMAVIGTLDEKLPIGYWACFESHDSYALAVVKLCKKTNNSRGDVEFRIPLMLKQWLARLEATIGKDDQGYSAGSISAERIEICPGCKQWQEAGKITHLKNCTAKTWDAIEQDHKAQASNKELELLKIKDAIATAKKKAKLGPPINAPSPKKSKSHPQGSYPLIVPGGAVETKRRKF